MSRPIGCKNYKWDKTILTNLYSSGLSTDEIGGKLGLTGEAVRTAMHRIGIPLRSISDSIGKEKHYNWKGGRYAHKNGYIYVRADGHPRATKRHYIFEQILVVEKQLGHYLRKDEVVHHLNGIKTDNRPENLIVLRQQDHNRVIPVLKERIRKLEAENKRLAQEVMLLDV